MFCAQAGKQTAGKDRIDISIFFGGLNAAACQLDMGKVKNRTTVLLQSSFYHVDSFGDQRNPEESFFLSTENLLPHFHEDANRPASMLLQQ